MRLPTHGRGASTSSSRSWSAWTAATGSHVFHALSTARARMGGTYTALGHAPHHSSSSNGTAGSSTRAPRSRGTGTAQDHRTTLLLLVTCVLWYASSAMNATMSQALLKAKGAPHHQHQHGAAALQHPASGAVVPPNLDLHHAATAAAAAATGQKLPPLFPYPITLTLIQFASVNLGAALCCSQTLLGARRLGTLVWPSWRRVWAVGQLSVFNVVGHLFAGWAISRVPVSTVQTIKALSPLVTVVAYSSLLNVSYPLKTYLSLLPLTLGVMLVCSGLALSGDDVLGFSAALASTLAVVAQNIYSKKLLGGSSGQGEGKMDKLNIMFVSSATSCVFLIPSFLLQDVPRMLLGRSTAPLTGAQRLHILFLLTANCISHFSQNLFAFSVLGLVSPVTYSIASLFKRVFVIIVAIVWFGQAVTFLQGVGIIFTFGGLYLYNESKPGKVDEQIERRERQQALHLPLPGERQLAEADLRASAAAAAADGLGKANGSYPPAEPYRMSTTASQVQHGDPLSARHRMLHAGLQPSRIHHAAAPQGPARLHHHPPDLGQQRSPSPLLAQQQQPHERSFTPPGHPHAAAAASSPSPLRMGTGRPPVPGAAAAAVGPSRLPTPPESTKGPLEA